MKEVKNEIKTLICTHCGQQKTVAQNNFFISYSPLYKATRYMPICKNCITELFMDLLNKNGGDKKESLIQLCELLDKPFISKVYDDVWAKNSKEPDEKIIGEFFKQVHMQQWRKRDIYRFKDSIIDNRNVGNEVDNVSSSVKIDFTEKDKKTKDEVIKLMGYDPFFGYELYDQKFLYNELFPYLDDGTVEDTFKLSQVIQLVNNNNQIRKIDLAINLMSSNIQDLLKNQGDIKSATGIKNQIVTATDKIAKENSISVKNRSDKSAGKSTLTNMMKEYRELGFENAEQDYYDQNKAKGMQMVADISNKSIMEQLQFDENDYNDMIIQQRNLITELQQRVDDLEEENRQLYVKIGKLENGEVN